MIRIAKTDDSKRIFALYKRVALNWEKIDDESYRKKIQLSGYLFGISSEKELEHQITNAFLTLVYEENSTIIGYVLLNKETYFPKEAENIMWTKKEFKNSFFTPETMATVYHITVDPNYSRMHIGRKLLKKGEKIAKKKGIKQLFSIIQINPIINVPSVIFHSKQNFEVA